MDKRKIVQNADTYSLEITVAKIMAMTTGFSRNGTRKIRYTKHLIEISLRMYKRGQQFDERATYSSRNKMKPFTEQGANAGRESGS